MLGRPPLVMLTLVQNGGKGHLPTPKDIISDHPNGSKYRYCPLKKTKPFSLCRHCLSTVEYCEENQDQNCDNDYIS